MAYTDRDFKTKKELKEYLGSGKEMSVYQPGGIFPLKPYTKTVKGKVVHVVALEGPHFPKPHTWYGEAVVEKDDYGTYWIRSVK